MKKQKILIIFTLMALALSFIPCTSASTVTIATYTGENADPGIFNGLHPASGVVESAQGTSFTVTTPGYITSVYAKLEGTSPELIGGGLACVIVEVSGTNPNNLPTATALEYSDAINAYEVTSNNWYSFDFDGTLLLENGVVYGLYLYTIGGTWNNSQYIHWRGYNTGAYTGGNQFTYYSSDWHVISGGSPAFIIYGSDVSLATPTPSPSPSPTPFTYQGDIWAVLVPYGTLILPLILILIVALICGKYAGVWGFFAGLNVAAILVYAIMGSAYLPLWGIVMLALVDGLLLFGKISGRM